MGKVFLCLQHALLRDSRTLKDKSGVGIIVDYSIVFYKIFALSICETTYFNLLRSAK